MEQVTEDMKVVTHIRDVFAALNDISVGHVSSTIQSSVKNTLSLVYFFFLVYACACISSCVYFESICPYICVACIYAERCNNFSHFSIRI